MILFCLKRFKKNKKRNLKKTFKKDKKLVVVLIPEQFLSNFSCLGVVNGCRVKMSVTEMEIFI